MLTIIVHRQRGAGRVWRGKKNRAQDVNKAAIRKKKRLHLERKEMRIVRQRGAVIDWSRFAHKQKRIAPKPPQVECNVPSESPVSTSKSELLL